MQPKQTNIVLSTNIKIVEDTDRLRNDLTDVLVFCAHVQPCLIFCSPPGFSMEFSRQEYWSGFPFPAPGDPPDPGIEPAFLALAHGLFTTEPPRKCFSIA